MFFFLARWIITAIGLGAASWILPGVHISSWTALAVAALVLAFVNAVIRPIMVILTLPITILTLGLFYFVVNGFAFEVAAAVVPGFRVDSFGWAMAGAVVTGVLSWFISGFRDSE